MTCLVLLVTLASNVCRAEMSEDDYRSGKSLGSPAERERTAAELEAERAQAASIEAQQEAAEQAQREQEALLAQRRPLGERLLHGRCTGCHTLAVTDGLARGALGWRFTVERMRWWHGAALNTDEAATVASYLRTIRPASHFRDWLEAALAASCIMIAAMLPLAWRRLRRRRGATR